jgi:hypothetical protein
MDKFITRLNQLFEDNKNMYEDEGLPFIKTIDKFRNQPLNPEAFDLFELPAIFVNRSIQWEKSGKTYNGIMTVEYHVVQDATWPTENFSTNIEEGLKQYQFLSITRYLLDDFESDNTSKQQRVNETPIDADGSIYDLLTYTCNYFDPFISGKKYVETQGDALNVEKVIKQKSGL